MSSRDVHANEDGTRGPDESATVRGRRSSPILVELQFVLGVVFGALLVGLGFALLVLGLSLGVEGRPAVSGSLRVAAIVGGVAVGGGGLWLRRSRHDASREYMERVTGAVGAASPVVGAGLVLLGLDGLGLLSLPVLDAGTLLPAAVSWSIGTVGLGVVLVGLAVPLFRRTSGTPRSDLELVLWGTGTAVLMVGLTAFFVGASAHSAVSSPFLETVRDKVLLVLIGQLLLFAGWTTIRLAGRAIGW